MFHDGPSCALSESASHDETGATMFLVKQRDPGVTPYGRVVWRRELVLRRSPVHKIRMKPCERQALP
jgi:hypothetical protein